MSHGVVEEAGVLPEKIDKEKVRDLLLHGIPEVFRWEDDDIALRAAAMHSRLPPDRLTAAELAAFPEAANGATRILFLYIRNKTLQMWLMEPNVELTTDIILLDLVPPYNSDTELVRRIHAFLNRYGYINFGNYHAFSKHVPKKSSPHVIVIGGGASGVATAKQLLKFGFRVTMLEGRKRLGGRMHSYIVGADGSNLSAKEKHQRTADLGAMVVMGVEGNPMTVLARQQRCHLMRMSEGCRVFDTAGRGISEKRDHMIEEAFRKIGDTAAYIAHTMGVREINGEKLSLQQVYDGISNMNELKMQQKRLRFWKRYSHVTDSLDQIHTDMLLYKQAAEQLAGELQQLRGRRAAGEGAGDDLASIALHKCIRRDLNHAIRMYDAAAERAAKIDSVLKQLKSMEPSQVFMNVADRRLLDFHYANLEFATGAPLKELSCADWDQDDSSECTGSHYTVKEGYMTLICSMLPKEHVLFSHVVQSIDVTEKGASVRVHDTVKDVWKTLEADAVVCTVPLGVLKRPEGAEGSISFTPPLPEKKKDAIEKLGFGSLNKIVMVFERIFWQTDEWFFGCLNPTEASRGEMYMFMTYPDRPIIMGLLAGESSRPNVDPNEMSSKAMGKLRDIFGAGNMPKEPRYTMCTKWHTDVFAGGCYSYVGKEAKAEMYDDLASPVSVDDAKPRLFFAGEHTCRNYPSSVHGAWLSGIREAARIADQFLGCPYAPADPEAVIMVEDSDEEEAPAAAAAAAEEQRVDDDGCVMLD